MSDLEIGQVIALKIFYTNDHTSVAEDNHPYLVYKIDETNNTVEVIQFDKLDGKEYMSGFKYVETILCDNPNETVIDRDSMAVLNMKITIENDVFLEQFRRQRDKLSPNKLRKVFDAYDDYQRDNDIKPERVSHMSVSDIRAIN